MKKRTIISLLILSIGFFACQHASAVDLGAPYVELGMTNLMDQDLTDANSNFENAVSVEPSYAPANFLLAATRLLVLEQSPAGSNFLNGLGVPVHGRNYYAWTALPATNSEGKPEFPKGYNSVTVLAFYTNTLMPVISASLTNLANITDPTFQLSLPGAVTGGGAYAFQDVTVDYGDVQVLRSLLTAARFFGYSLTANNADADLSWIETNIQAGTLTFQGLLSQFPSLGSKQNTAALAPSEQAAISAIQIYFGAATFILDDRTDTNALFNLPTNDIPDEIEFQTELTNILAALTTPTQLAPSNVDSTLYLAPYFAGNVSLRSLVPKFNGNTYAPGSVPDYTFGGILPDLPAVETETLLMNKFPNYAGIYLGDDGLSDSYLYAGSFAAYITTNGQLTVVGADDGDGAGEGTDFGVLVQTTLNKGNWQTSNSVFNAYGNVSTSGYFIGEIDYNNGESVYLNANLESPLGQFQNSAGYYTGSYSGSQSGSLYSIVAADGEIYFTTGVNGPGGNDGGSGQFYNSDNDFETVESDGTEVVGILNTNSASKEGTNYFYDPITGNTNFYSVDSIGAGSIVGIYTNVNGNIKGTFTLSRSSKDAFDVPPTITTNLYPYWTVRPGTPTTFTLGASGSAPLRYQWYDNGNLIPNATSNTLVITNGAPGNYTISATVTDVAGETNSQECSVYVTMTNFIPYYAGIYIGDSALSGGDVVDTLLGGSGGFAAYVSTNGQMTLLGQDDGDRNPIDGDDFGFFIQTTLVNGGFQYNNSYVSASGYIDVYGDFTAQLYYPQANGGSGEFLYLQGNVEVPQGPFQTADGLYGGSATSSQGNNPLYIIVDPNGNDFLEPINSTADGSPYGNPATGAYGAFYGSTQFTDTSIDETLVSGSLHSNTTYTITGTYTNANKGNHGTFSVSRSSTDYAPIAPTITSDLSTTLFLPLGNIPTFHLGASGTALNYQWYFGTAGPVFNPIPGATTNTLVASNLWTTTGTYYIYATVANSVGSTNSQICNVIVTPETNIPTVAITSPKAGELWSNSTFIVTGTASDKVAVTDVVCVVDGTNYGTISTNNYNNWFVPVLLNSGSNTINAYAINQGPIPSKTSTVFMNYIVSAPMTVVTNGPGSINPNYNSVPLQIGKNYSMTATGASHFMLTNWSSRLAGGPLTTYTNKPPVIFSMQSNLVMQANFHDTLAPYLKITNATQGMVLWTNASFTVMGVATDDQEVATVTYSLNGAATALPINDDIATWQAPLTLAEGTNIFRIYTQATNGNLSVTDTVDLVYAVSNLLTVATNGPGTVSPNYNNQFLRVGENYSMTAAPASHFIFTNWSSGLLGSPLTTYTNKATAIFEMASNLVMQVNFHDALAPYLKITNATQGMVLWTNASFTVMGVATDDQEVATVTYSLNGAATTLPINNDIATWQAPLTLAEGTNIFSIYAQATNGNYSVTNTVDLVYAVSNLLTVVSNGRGSFSPNYNGQSLRIGENYSMTATAGSGFVFTNWMGGIIGGPMMLYTNKPTVTFMMETNLELQANFLDTLKPYLKITNPISSVLFVTNMSTYSVTGVATDDEEVASVNYTLNGAASALPISKNISGWQASLTLAEGTNSFSAWAAATNGNISATDTIKIVRQPIVTTFLIASNSDITQPQAQLAFDGTNYLVVYSENGPVGQIVSTNGALAGGPLALNPGYDDDPPCLDFDGTNYLVAWLDHEGFGDQIKGVFVSPGGTFASTIVPLTQSFTADKFGTIVYGGGVYFLLWSDYQTTPDSIHCAIVQPPGGLNALGDFVLSTNGTVDEATGPAAAFDGTNFLAVWSSATNKLTISGQLVSLSGPIGNPFIIYTNAATNGVTVPSVVFNGANYLVLFNVGITSTNASASGFHVLGRLVTTAGGVLTNQITLTSDAGPQIAAGVDFDGVNSLASWNQGWNPFSLTTSGTINGRFSNPQGNPTSAEFPIFATRPAGFTWTFAPVFFDGTKFVLVGGLGKMVTPAPSMVFTNGAIYGAFIDGL